MHSFRFHLALIAGDPFSKQCKQVIGVDIKSNIDQGRVGVAQQAITDCSAQIQPLIGIYFHPHFPRLEERDR